MQELIKKLFPICRSITGEGFRKSLDIINQELGGIINLHEIKSGSEVFDWVVPDEWNINDAYIIDPDGNKICDFKVNNLHVLNYSEPTDKVVDLKELEEHLYSLPSLPDAIPYTTSYYKRRWGFCIAHNERQKLKDGKYRVFIDSSFNKDGVLNYGDFVIKANTNTKEEILISTYLCHPSMANNELSGPAVSAYLAKWLMQRDDLKYNYRFVFIPETIGSIVYLSRNLKILQENVKAGFVLSCVGDDDAYSLIHSPSEDNLAEKVAFHIMKDKQNFKEFSFLDAGSDERQYCSPLVDLPVCGICRTKYGEFEQYHTSKDDLSYVSQKGLENSLQTMKDIIMSLELNEKFISNVFCEPNLGKRGLYPTFNSGTSAIQNNRAYFYRKFLAFCDGKNDAIDIVDKMGDGMKLNEFKYIIEALVENDLIRVSR
ncbi:aminopeptidase [Campylobacter pinnipediorum subsp. pinnipediorum]|uniref:Aminopeptidase n=1 Tax=Campylobacter pinnipediorum subsp. pinnipediorum TaxID=1660067 RepID=A0AAX0L983_9BACT|nr:DUF4910 domain-containing protein [Campylobacter pinnipediorum]OPA75833.1 aminopeptidase [Campylobacter pinnipediorum subsp. pinnipediorum]